MLSRESRTPAECLDCGASLDAKTAAASTRCKQCVLKYQVQVFLLRKFLSETAFG
jgi:DNA-directed RNA polymerase subunit RPC12/RpoP